MKKNKNPSTPDRSQMGTEVNDYFENDPFPQSTDPSAPPLHDGTTTGSRRNTNDNPNNELRVYNAVDDSYEDWGQQRAVHQSFDQSDIHSDIDCFPESR